MKKTIIASLFIIGSALVTFAQVGGVINTKYGSVGLSPNGSISATVRGSIGGNQISVGYGSGTMCGVGGNALLNLLCLAQTMVSRLVPFAIGLGVLAFFWFLVEFIWKGRESPDDQQKGLKGMGYSIVAIFVMVSIWGIVTLIGTMLGVGQGGGLPPIQMPTAK